MRTPVWKTRGHGVPGHGAEQGELVAAERVGLADQPGHVVGVVRAELRDGRLLLGPIQPGTAKRGPVLDQRLQADVRLAVEAEGVAGCFVPPGEECRRSGAQLAPAHAAQLAELRAVHRRLPLELVSQLQRTALAGRKPSA
jgi:hypothetical protein